MRAVHASGLEQGRDGAWVRGCSAGCSGTKGALGLDGMGHHPGQPRGVLNCAHLLEATYGPSADAILVVLSIISVISPSYVRM